MQVADKPDSKRLNSQAFTAFRTARIDDGASSASFHANQKTMGAGATCFRRLVSTFHFENAIR
jgi:hypothetical protein